jgi:hypothetical protein
MVLFIESSKIKNNFENFKNKSLKIILKILFFNKFFYFIIKCLQKCPDFYFNKTN